MDNEERQPDQREPEGRGIGPGDQQRERQQQADRGDDREIALAPRQPLAGARDQCEQAPMERRKAAIADKQSQLKRTNHGRGGAQRGRARPLERHHRQRDGEKKYEAADRERRDHVECGARDDHPNSPADPADQRRERQPRPSPGARDAGEPGDGQRQIDGEQRYIGLDGADHGGRS